MKSCKDTVIGRISPLLTSPVNAGRRTSVRALGAALGAFLCTTLAATTSQASTVDSNWYEIELIAYSQTPDNLLFEQFPRQAPLVNTLNSLDLRGASVTPNIRPLLAALPSCSDIKASNQQREQIGPASAQSQQQHLLGQAWLPSPYPSQHYASDARLDSGLGIHRYPARPAVDVAETWSALWPNEFKVDLRYRMQALWADEDALVVFSAEQRIWQQQLQRLPDNICQFEPLEQGLVYTALSPQPSQQGQVANADSAILRLPSLSLSVIYNDSLSGLERLPTVVDGQEQHQASAYIASAQSLKMQDLAYQIKHRGGHDLLLHTVWRQPLQSRSQSRPLRWFAGQNYSKYYHANGQLKQPTPLANGYISAQSIDTLAACLDSPQCELADSTSSVSLQSHQPVWQLDGLVHLYLDRMIFARTAFNLRRQTSAQQPLQVLYSAESTRILLDEVHYIDHPYLGLVLQVRRFTPPLQATSLVNTGG